MTQAGQWLGHNAAMTSKIAGYVGPKFMAQTPWLGIDHLRFGLIGAPVCLILMIVVSLATEEPDAKTQQMVDDIRIPTGKTVSGLE